MINSHGFQGISGGGNPFRGNNRLPNKPFYIKKKKNKGLVFLWLQLSDIQYTVAHFVNFKCTVSGICRSTKNKNKCK